MFRQTDLECEHDASEPAPTERRDEVADTRHPEVFSLLDCPPFPAGNFALARREATGEMKLLMIGRAPFAAPTLNRAFIRRNGALLGVTEVHLWKPRG